VIAEQHGSLQPDDLRALPEQTQITNQHCIQGWSAVGNTHCIRRGVSRCGETPKAERRTRKHPPQSEG
jgi:DMSO/TMAO reductase YedYZ molybdopterin-dependent catalytic subunit